MSEATFCHQHPHNSSGTFQYLHHRTYENVGKKKKKSLRTFSSCCYQVKYRNVKSLISMFVYNLHITPHFLHYTFHFLAVFSRCQLDLSFCSKLCCIQLCKLFECESPAMETRTKANSTTNWINLVK